MKQDTSIYIFFVSQLKLLICSVCFEKHSEHSCTCNIFYVHNADHGMLLLCNLSDLFVLSSPKRLFNFYYCFLACYRGKKSFFLSLSHTQLPVIAFFTKHIMNFHKMPCHVCIPLVEIFPQMSPPAKSL